MHVQGRRELSLGGAHSGGVAGSDDEGDTSFTAVGGVVHDDAPTLVPSPAPTLSPSPECPGGESLYKLLLPDGFSDGWEGATYRVVDADGTVAVADLLEPGADAPFHAAVSFLSCCVRPASAVLTDGLACRRTRSAGPARQG